MAISKSGRWRWSTKESEKTRRNVRRRMAPQSYPLTSICSATSSIICVCPIFSAGFLYRVAHSNVSALTASRTSTLPPRFDALRQIQIDPNSLKHGGFLLLVPSDRSYHHARLLRTRDSSRDRGLLDFDSQWFYQEAGYALQVHNRNWRLCESDWNAFSLIIIHTYPSSFFLTCRIE